MSASSAPPSPASTATTMSSMASASPEELSATDGAGDGSRRRGSTASAAFVLESYYDSLSTQSAHPQNVREFLVPLALPMYASSVGLDPREVSVDAESSISFPQWSEGARARGRFMGWMEMVCLDCPVEEEQGGYNMNSKSGTVAEIFRDAIWRKEKWRQISRDR